MANFSSKGTLYGMENGNECYCGGAQYNKHGPSENCNRECEGELGRICGGDHAISVYQGLYQRIISKQVIRGYGLEINTVKTLLRYVQSATHKIQSYLICVTSSLATQNIIQVSASISERECLNFT